MKQSILVPIFPDEYTNSNYSHRIYGTIGKAKANVSQAIPALIEIATNITFHDNTNEKHKSDAKFGWYRCTVRFSIPTCDDKGHIVARDIKKRNVVRRLSLRCTEKTTSLYIKGNI